MIDIKSELDKLEAGHRRQTSEIQRRCNEEVSREYRRYASDYRAMIVANGYLPDVLRALNDGIDLRLCSIPDDSWLDSDDIEITGDFEDEWYSQLNTFDGFGWVDVPSPSGKYTLTDEGRSVISDILKAQAHKGA